MSIFPFLDGFISDDVDTEEQELPIPKEYAWDFERDCFKLVNGKMVVVEGVEAIKIWCYKALKTQRYRYYAYSFNYGSELEELIGMDYTKAVKNSEAKRYVEECLSINPYIIGIDNFVADFSKDVLKLSFRIKTIYGEVDLDVQ